MLLSSSSRLLYFVSNSPPMMNNPTPHQTAARKIKIIGMPSLKLGSVRMARRYSAPRRMRPPAMTHRSRMINRHADRPSAKLQEVPHRHQPCPPASRHAIADSGKQTALEVRATSNENKMSDGWPAAAGKLCGAWLRFHLSFIPHPLFSAARRSLHRMVGRVRGWSAQVPKIQAETHTQRSE